MLWLEVLWSLEGGARAIEGQMARFKQTQSWFFFFQKQHDNGELLVPASSVLNHSIICLSAAYGSCTSHALPSEIGMHIIPRSHCDYTVAITGRNESWATIPQSIYVVASWGEQMNMGFIFVFFLPPNDGRIDWEMQISLCLSPGESWGYMAEPVSSWLGEVRVGRCLRAEAHGSSGAIERCWDLQQRSSYLKQSLSGPKRTWGNWWDWSAL